MPKNPEMSKKPGMPKNPEMQKKKKQECQKITIKYELINSTQVWWYFRNGYGKFDRGIRCPIFSEIAPMKISEIHITGIWWKRKLQNSRHTFLITHVKFLLSFFFFLGIRHLGNWLDDENGGFALFHGKSKIAPIDNNNKRKIDGGEWPVEKQQRNVADQQQANGRANGKKHPMPEMPSNSELQRKIDF